MAASNQEEVQCVTGFGEFKSIATLKAITGLHEEDNLQMPDHLLN
jgi:hypothetical protein